MSSKILIDAIDTEDCRIAKVIDTKLEEFHIESSGISNPASRPHLWTLDRNDTVFYRSRKSTAIIFRTIFQRVDPY